MADLDLMDATAERTYHNKIWFIHLIFVSFKCMLTTVIPA